MSVKTERLFSYGTLQTENLEFTGSPADVVDGTALSLTPQELEQADAYEPDGYERVHVTLRSGTKAWVYLNATRSTK